MAGVKIQSVLVACSQIVAVVEITKHDVDFLFLLTSVEQLALPSLASNLLIVIRCIDTTSVSKIVQFHTRQWGWKWMHSMGKWETSTPLEEAWQWFLYTEIEISAYDIYQAVQSFPLLTPVLCGPGSISGYGKRLTRHGTIAIDWWYTWANVGPSFIFLRVRLTVCLVEPFAFETTSHDLINSVP